MHAHVKSHHHFVFLFVFPYIDFSSHIFSFFSIPPIEVITGDGGAAELKVTDDPFSALFFPGVLDRVPLCLSLCKLASSVPSLPSSSSASASADSGGEWLLDPSWSEEQCSSSRLTLAVTPSGRISAMEQSGLGCISPAALAAIMRHAPRMAEQMQRRMMEAIRETGGVVEKQRRKEKKGGTTNNEMKETTVSKQNNNQSSSSKKKKKTTQMNMEE